MEKMFILSPRESDAAVLSGGSWAAAAPLANLQDMQPTNSARTTDDSNASSVIILDALGAKAWDTLAFIRSNLSATGATVRLRADNDPENLTGTPGLDTTALSPWPISGRPADPGMVWFDVLKQFTPSEPYRYWRIDIDDDANADEYIEIGRLILGAAFVPHYNFAKNWSRVRAATDVRIKTPYGHTLTSPRKRPRLWTLPFDAVTPDDAEEGFDQLSAQRGTAGDVVVCLDPAATTRLHRKTMLATFDEPPQIGQPYFNSFRTTVNFYELL